MLIMHHVSLFQTALMVSYSLYIFILYIYHNATPLQLLHTFEVAPLRCPMFCRGTTTTEGLEVCFLGIRKGEGLMKRQ